MSNPPRIEVDLQTLCLQLRHANEQAEARLGTLNARLRDLHQLGLVGSVAVPGPVVLMRPYPESARQPNSGQVVQAVPTLPQGFGAVYWDAEDWMEIMKDPDGWGPAAVRQTTPFADCEPAVRALLAPHAAPLLEDFLRQIRFRWQA